MKERRGKRKQRNKERKRETEKEAGCHEVRPEGKYKGKNVVILLQIDWVWAITFFNIGTILMDESTQAGAAVK